MFKSLLLNEFLQSEIRQKSCSNQNIISIIAVADEQSGVICMFLVSDSSSNMQFTFFTLTTFIFVFFVFWKTINFAENLEMTRVAGGRGVMFFASL